MGMYISNKYSTVASAMKAQKIHTCTPKMYDVSKFATSAVTKASTRTSNKIYQTNMEGGEKMALLQKLGILNTKFVQQ